jgi:hypothetical protein
MINEKNYANIKCLVNDYAKLENGSIVVTNYICRRFYDYISYKSVEFPNCPIYGIGNIEDSIRGNMITLSYYDKYKNLHTVTVLFLSDEEYEKYYANSYSTITDGVNVWLDTVFKEFNDVQI